MSIQLSPQQTHLQPGYRLDGRYELLRPFAQGGMAVVWLARVVGKLGFEKLYAVKTILPHLSNDASFRGMFLDEARIASRIRHPNVAALEDLGEDQGVLYMVLEWVNGESLAKLHEAVTRKGGTIPLNILLRIMASAGAALHAAHELRDNDGRFLNLVHRDVSPQNILVTVGGVTKVIDFGVAKARDRLGETTKTGLLKGKVEYSAPERVRGKGDDRRVDVWALGAILYQYLAGRLPYEGNDDIAVLRQLAAGNPPPPLPPSVPEDVANVVMGCLRPKRDERIATAADLQRALEACIKQPTTDNDVATYLQTELANRLERRRVAMAESIAEADRAGDGQARPRFGSVPELAPMGENIPAPTPSEAGGVGGDTATGLSTTMPEARLRAVHWVVMLVAILVTIAIWAKIALVLTAPPRRGAIIECVDLVG